MVSAHADRDTELISELEVGGFLKAYSVVSKVPCMVNLRMVNNGDLQLKTGSKK